jgi:hypothetical protein
MAAVSRQSNRRRPKSRTQKTDPLPIVFRDVAALAFPIKTTAALGHLTGCSRSTIHTWLAGEHEPPAYVLALVFAEIMRRLAGQ